MKLLYHSLTSESSVSPFDQAILEVAAGQPIKIISPYLGLSYLRRLTSCCTDWRLVSDIEEWLSAAKKERPQTVEFIKTHRNKIHHYPALHAKAVVSPHKAYLGSANLTASGIQLRTEIGVQLDELDAVQELNAWADSLWEVTQPPGVDELEAFFQQMTAQAAEASALNLEKKPKLNGVSVQVRAKLSDKPSGAPVPAMVSPKALEPESVQDAIGLFAPDGVSLKDLFELVSDGSSSARRRIMDEVSRLCANLGRSAYKLENEQKLVWDGCRLQQATPSSVQEALTPYDKFLAEVLNQLDLDQPKPLRDVTTTALDSGLPATYGNRLLKELTQIGLLASRAGGAYLLNDDIDWPPSKKYYQFKRAGIVWEAAMERARRSRRDAVVLPSIVPEDPKRPLQPLVVVPPPSKAAAKGEPVRKPNEAAQPLPSGRNSELPYSTPNLKQPRSLSVNELDIPVKLLELRPAMVSTTKPEVAFVALPDTPNTPQEPKPKVAIVSREPMPTREASKDEVYLRFVQLLEQSNGRLSFKEPAALFNYLALKLNTTSSRVTDLLTAKTRSGRANEVAPLFTVTAGKGQVLVDINSADLSKARYPQTAKYIKERISAGSEFIRTLMASKNLPAQRSLVIKPSETPNSLTPQGVPSTSRLDQIQLQLLTIATTDGWLKVAGLNEVHQLLLTTIPDLTAEEFMALTRSYKNQLVIPPLFLSAPSQQKLARILLRTRHESLTKYPLTTILLPRYRLGKQSQP